MGEICGVKFNIYMCMHTSQKFNEIPLCAKKVNFITEFVISGKTLPFYDIRENNFAHGGISEFFS